MKILVFLHGTIIMHKGAEGKTREERVNQVKTKEKSVSGYVSYVPIQNAVDKLKTWERQGGIIQYLSSHTNVDDVQKDEAVLERYGFPHGEILYRKAGESYADVVERVSPNIFIEDDCESIGGQLEMVTPHLSSEERQMIRCIVVPEFGGIDHLPEDLGELGIFQA